MKRPGPIASALMPFTLGDLWQPVGVSIAKKENTSLQARRWPRP